MTCARQEMHDHVVEDFLEQRLSAIGPDAIVAAGDLEEVREQAAMCQNAISSDAGIQALLDLAQHVRSPRAIDFVANLRDRLSKTKVALTRDEIRFLLKLALHVKRRKRKLHARKRIDDEAPGTENATLVSVSATRTTSQ